MNVDSLLEWRKELPLMSRPFDVVVCGHLCLDLIPSMRGVKLSALATPGRLYEIDSVVLSTGGSVSNTGLALHRLGVEVRMIAQVGDDFVGHTTLAVLNARDPSLTEFIKLRSDQPSSSTIVLTPIDADRILLHCTGTNNTFSIDDIDFGVISRARIFHLGYPPLLPHVIQNDGEELARILRKAQESGAITSMDMALPDPNGHSGNVNWRTILQNALPYVDIFLPSAEEILFMLRRQDYDAWKPHALSHLNRMYLHRLSQELIDMGAAIVGFKLGEYGIYLRSGSAKSVRRIAPLGLAHDSWTNVELWSPAYQVTVAGTTGAGDSAYAGFLTALLHGLQPTDAVRWACAVGASNVEAYDSTGGVQDYETTALRMASGWSFRSERLVGMDGL